MHTLRHLPLVCSTALFCSVLPALTAAQAAPPQAAPADWKFDFSAGPAKVGSTRVLATAVYSDDAGYGYEPGAQVATGDNGNTTTSDRPFLFSAKVPEGNFNVTVTFGDSSTATTPAVEASGSLLSWSGESPVQSDSDRTVPYASAPASSARCTHRPESCLR